MKNELKTKPTGGSVSDYLNAITDPTRQADAKKVVELMHAISKEDPIMWSSIIGFGSYHYKYASGRQGDWMRLGLAARKDQLSLYGVIYYDHNTKLLDKLGKHTHGKGCLYIKKLSDVNLDILEQMIKNAWSQKAPEAI